MAEDPADLTTAFESRSTARIVIVTPHNGPPTLIVEFDIHCPLCGEQSIQVAGHHLRMIRDVLIETIDEHPELTRGEYRQWKQERVAGRANDPSTS